MKLLRIVLCVFTVVFFTACDRKESKTINMARANWDTGYFHAEIYKIGLEKLGYEIPKLKDVNLVYFMLRLQLVILIYGSMAG